jgi:hypothetical protein
MDKKKEMKKYTIIVSRYQSVALTIEASSLEKAEELAIEVTDGGGFFYDHDDIIEAVDSWEETDEDAYVVATEEE